MRRTRPTPLRHRRLQSALAVAALATAVALPVVLLSVGGGVFHHELARLQNSGQEITVSAPGVHGVAGAHTLATRIAGLADVASASPVLSVAVEAYGTAGSSVALAEGIEPGPFEASLSSTDAPLFPHPIPLGDPADSAHFDGGRYDGPSAGKVLVSTPFAAAEQLRVGATIGVSGDSDRADARSFTVAGTFGVAGPTLGPTAVFGLLLPLSDLQEIAGLARGANGSVVDAADSIGVALTPVPAVQPSEIDRVARTIGAMVPYYPVSEVTTEATQLAEGQAVLTGFYLGLSAISLAVGLAFLVLLMLREVEVGRRALGIRRALGVPSGSIAAGLVGRGTLLALGGGAAGLGLGIVLIRALAVEATGTVAEVASLAEFDPVTLAGLLALVLALGAFAGGVAVRAALRRPIPELLR